MKIEGRTLLSDITWQLRRGENWALIGDNGAGKSTLLRLIKGELWPDPGNRGKRLYKFESDVQESPLGIKKRMAILSAELQDAYHRNQWNMSGREVVYTGFFDSAWLHQEPTEEQKDSAEQLLHELKLDNLGSKNFLEMSLGEARKILIARAMVKRPDILILDEPCSGLDKYARSHFLLFIEQTVQSGVSLIMATHHLDEILSSITHIMVIREGRIIAQGKKEEIMKENKLPFFSQR